MNKHCYRLIFSRTHGELRVVSELARSCSTEPGQSRGITAPRLWVTMRSSVWLLALALFAGPVMANGIVADGQAAPAQRPEVIATQNGLPQVNIAAPNQAGLSHNQYKQFDVDQKGAILNNSAGMTSTQLGGMIQGNPNLNPNNAPARVILNEVNSTNPSQLRGYLEVAGGKAQVIIANPAGLVCDGCGTINAGRMTVTTGKPQLNADGSLAGYQVERGTIRIQGGGLNGDSRHDTEYVDVLARAVEINAGVWAKEGLTVVAGRNNISADVKKVTARPTSDDDKPALAIDMGQMGGMYSGSIRMIGTEAGVGVRNQGAHLQAGKTLTVSSEGRLSWQPGKQEAVTQAGGDIQLAAKDDIEYQGKLHSAGNVVVESRSGKITQSGTLAASGDVQLTAAKGIQSSGHLLAGSDSNSQLVRDADLKLTTQGDIRASGSLLSKREVNLSGQRVDISQSKLAANRATLTAQHGGVALRQAQVDSDKLAINTTADVDAQQAKIKTGQWQVTANNLFNQNAIWSQTDETASQFSLSGALDNSGGSIEARQLLLDTQSLNNQSGSLLALGTQAQHWHVGAELNNYRGELGSNGDLRIDALSLNNQEGTLTSQSALHLQVNNDVNNYQGKLLAGKQLTLNSQGNINNQAGQLSAESLTLTSQYIDNKHGKMAAQQALILSASQTLDNRQGQLNAGSELSVATAGNWDNRAGLAQGGSQVKANVANLDNSEGKLQSGGALDLNSSGDIINQHGVLTAQQALNWQGNNLSRFNNDGGSLQSGGMLSLQGGQLTNRQQGIMLGQQGVSLNLTGDWDNQGGTLTSQGTTQVRAANLLNTQGTINALASLDMQLTHNLDNRHGRIFSAASQRLQAQNIFNDVGWMGSQGSWQTVTEQFTNREGSIEAQQNAQLTASVLDNATGILQSAAGLALNVAQYINNGAGKISALEQLTLDLGHAAPNTGTLNNQGGQLLAGAALALTANALDNSQSGLVYSQKQLQLNLKQQLDNRQGQLKSGEALHVDAQSLLNNGGKIDSQQQLALSIAGLLDNSSGALRSNGDQQVNAGQLTNRQGLLSSLAGLSLTTGQLDNNDGTLVSQGRGTYFVDTLNNQQGKLYSNEQLQLTANQVNNQNGKLVATGDFNLHTTQLDNRAQGTVSSQGQLLLQANQVNNSEGGLLLGSTHTEINSGELNNNAGRLQSAGSLTLAGLNSLDNRQGKILSNGALNLNTQTLLNQSGIVQSGNTLNLSSGSLNNQGGTVQSQQALTLAVQQDYTHQAGDTLSSNSAVIMSVAGVLTNLTDWLLPGNFTLTSTHFTNQGSLVGKAIQLTSGLLLNQGRLEADNLTLDIDALNNQGAVMGDEITVRSRLIDNQSRNAVIAATQTLDLRTNERLSNRDGALLYSAGNLSLNSNDLIENHASFIEADGNITLEAKRLENLREGLVIDREAEKSDYKWHRYNYYWRSYGADVNTDVSTMAPNTQRLTFRDDAAAESNPYGTLLNIDAAAKRAQVRVKNNTGQLINLWVNYLALTPHADGSYAMTFYDVRGWNQDVIPTPYQNSFRREHDIGQAVVWDPDKFLDIATTPFVSDYNNLRERSATGTLTRDKLVSEGIGARILAGGNMLLRITGQLLNDASTITANRDLTIEGNGKVENKGYSVNEHRVEYLVDHYDRNTIHWHPEFVNDTTTALSTIDGIITGNGNVRIQGANISNTTVNQAQISSVEAALKAADAERAEWERNPLAFTVDGVDSQQGNTQLSPLDRPLLPAELALTEKQHLGNIATNIPDNGLFRQDSAIGTPFLVVTDPRFTSRDKFISSDYLLARVGYDPSQVHKRLGDGFYEQRLVREQVLKLTGRPSVHGEDAMAQYQALMNNGAKVAQDFHLVPGVALTPQQIAALQQDIVWMVSETVETKDGPQQVWVPKVYLANTTLRLTANGALIGGGNLQLSADSVNNAGNLFADQSLKIDARQFMHQSGDIKADKINVQADSLTISTNLQDALRQASMSANDISLSGNDILLQGAKLDAKQDLSLSARNNLAIETARSNHTANLEIISGSMGNRTAGGMEDAGSRMARVSAELQQAQGSELKAGGNLSLNAGQDIRLQGSQAKAGGQLDVQAGGDIQLLADTTTNKTQLNANSRTSSVSNSREEQRLQLSTLSGDQGVKLIAGNNLLAQGAQVGSTEGNIGVTAQTVTIKEARQQTLDLDSQTTQRGKTKGSREVETSHDNAIGSTFSGRDGVNITAREGDIAVTGSTLHSEQGAIALQAKNDVTITNTTEHEYQLLQESNRARKKQNQREVEVSRDIVVGSSLSGRDGVTVIAREGNITATASTLHSEQGAVVLEAKQDVTLNSATERESQYTQERSQKKGFLKKSSSSSQAKDSTTREKGTLLSGDTVSVKAGNDLLASGSAIVGDGDVNLQAGNHVNILAATETDTHYLLEEKKKSGLLGGGGLGFTIGKQSSKHEVDEKGTTQSQSVSTVGSNQGNVTITAGNQLHIGGADLVAGKDINLSGDSVQIDPGYDKRTRTEKFETKQTGLNLALSGAIGSALNSAVTTAQQATKESDGRLAALQGTKSALSGVQALQSSEKLGLDGKEQKEGFAVSMSLGSQKSSSTQYTEQAVSSGSTLNAGNNINVTATGKQAGTQSGDITMSGSQLKAGGDTTLNAQRDLLLSAAADTQKQDGSNKSSGGSVGMSVGVGKSNGVSLFANTNTSRGKEHGNGTSWNETTIDSGNKVTLNSGRDTALVGAQVNGDKIIANVGRDLTLQSLQNSDRYDSKQTNMSGGVSIPLGAGTSSVNLSASKDKIKSNFDSVQEQTGLFAGKGGFDIKVGEHTQLEGAVIASTADKQKNTLETGTLGWSDIQNKAEFSAQHSGVSLSSGGPVGKDLLTNLPSGMVSAANNTGNAEGTTQSAISEGNLIVRDQDKQQQDVATLSRDTDNANGSITPIFDKEKEQNRLKQAQLIGEIGAQAMDIISTQGDINGLKAAKDKHPGKNSDELRQTKEYQDAMKQYGTGSELQKAAQAITRALTALSGNNLAGALAGGASPYLATEIKKQTTDANGDVNVLANTMAHAVLGAITAQLNNQSALAGGLGAGSAELAAREITKQMFPGKEAKDLTESERQQVSALSQLAAGLAGGITTGDTAGAITAAQTGKNAVENNFLSGDMYALDRKVKAAKEKGEDIEPILEDARKQSLKDREKMESSCKANPDTCGFSLDAANDAQSKILENGPFLNIDPDVAKLVAQETAKDNAVIRQNTSEFGKGLVVASEGLSIIAGMGTSAALNVLKTGGAIRDPKTGSTVTVYRVEGVPNTRVLIGEKGQVTITGETTLYLNFGDKARAQAFLQKRISQNMEGATVKTFEVPTSVLNDLRNSAVKESVARLPENKGKPVIADPTKADNQYGIRPDKLKELQDKIIQGSGKNEYKR